MTGRARAGRAAGLAATLALALAVAGPLAASAGAQGVREGFGGDRGGYPGGDVGGFGRRSQPGDFDFYVLALSWSPTYCAGEGGRRDEAQCAPGRGLGFVLHGLWPQYAHGYPEACGAAPRPITPQAIAVAGQVYPSEGLARYEWRKHGTCSGLDPAAYFAAARDARLAVTIPEDLRAGGQTLAPVEVARRFVAANRGLRPDMMAVACARGRLTEVRVCLTKDLRGFTPCPEVARADCRAPEIALDPAR